MSKKSNVIVDSGDGLTEAEVSEAGRVLRAGVQEPPLPVYGSELFVVGSWKNYVQWQCALCPFDTLESEAVMREHIEKVHLPPPPKPERVALPLLDRFGNPIVVEH